MDLSKPRGSKRVEGRGGGKCIKTDSIYFRHGSERVVSSLVAVMVKHAGKAIGIREGFCACSASRKSKLSAGYSDGKIQHTVELATRRYVGWSSAMEVTEWGQASATVDETAVTDAGVHASSDAHYRKQESLRKNFLKPLGCWSA